MAILHLRALQSLLEQVITPDLLTSPVPNGKPASYDSAAVLILPSGQVVASAASFEFASLDRLDKQYRDYPKVLAGTASEVWRRDHPEVGADQPSGGSGEGTKEGQTVENADGDAAEDEEEDMPILIECELGRVIVCPLFPSPTFVNGHPSPPSSNSDKSSNGKRSPTEPDRPSPYVLFGFCAPESVPWAMLHAKARAVGDHLQSPMAEIGPKAAALKVRTVSVNIGAAGGRRAGAGRGAGPEV